MTPTDIPAAVPDDSGSDAFRRFVYQAEVAFKYCLDCATVGNVVSVTMEHFEDMALQFQSGGWRFAQVKTRDASQGPWTLPNLVASGAFATLLRTHRALEGVTADIHYEIVLEGAVKTGNPAAALLIQGPGLNDALIADLATRFGIDEAECEGFLQKLRIRDRIPSRDTIAASNIRTLGLVGRSVTLDTATSVYQAVLEKIKLAMESRLLEDRWPHALVEPETQEDAEQLVIEGKKLTRSELSPLLEPLHIGDLVLLTPLLEGDEHITAMEEKLRAAGATDEIVNDARMLRANASIAVSELQASSAFDVSDSLLDVRTRLGVLANAVAAVHLQDDRPSLGIWNDLVDKVNSQAQALDQQSLLRQDAMLLLGSICQAADDCEFWWGAPHAS